MRGVKLLAIFTLYAWHAAVIEARSGPYKVSFISIKHCSNPTLPVDKDPIATFIGELYNTTTETNLMRGNITVHREQRFKKVTAKSYVWEHNKWKINYKFENMGCNRIFLPMAAMSVGLKYNSKTCALIKGVVVFSNFNVNKVQHMWMTTQMYGRLLWTTEVFSQIGTAMCLEFDTLVVPADH